MFSFRKEDMIITGFIGVLLILTLFMIKSFLIPLMFTLLLVYILNPLYKYLNKNIFHSSTLTSLFITIIILILFILPLTFSMVELTGEINNINDVQIANSLSNLELVLNNKFNLQLSLMEQYNLAIVKIKDIISDTIYKVPKIIFDIFIILFFYYYFSKNYNHEINFLQHMFESRKLNHIKKQLSKLIHGIIYGQIFVRFIQAVLGTIGFLIIGINGAVFWGFAMFFMAFIPMIGTGIIWGPLALLHFLKGDIFSSVAIIIIGIIISTIDNILLPYVVSGKTNIGPVFTLISIIGGIEFFGIYGIILGPFILGFLFVLLEELFIEIRNANPKLRKFIWTETERNDFRKLLSDIERADFIKIINKKYEKKIKKTI